MLSSSSNGPTDLRMTISDRVRSDLAGAEWTLQTLAERFSPAGLFAAAFVALVVRPVSAVAETGHSLVSAKLERLAFHLWRHPRPGVEPATAVAVEAALSAVDTLVHAALLDQAFRPGKPHDSIDDFMRHVLIDAHVVRGSAYPEQTAEELVGIAGRFDAWFTRVLGTSVTDLVKCIWAIGWRQEAKLLAWLETLEDAAAKSGPMPAAPSGLTRKVRRRLARDQRRRIGPLVKAAVAREASEVAPVSRTECTLANGAPPSEQTWTALVRLIGLTPQIAASITDVLLARTRPIFVFDGDRVLAGDVSNSLDTLWDALDAYARADSALRDRYQDAKAEWLEGKTAESLARVFGHDAVFRNLRYPDPDRPGAGAETELDAAVRWGPFLLLVEAKAKQFRLKGQLGDFGRLRDDLKANIEDAFTQALRARRFLVTAEAATFREAATGRLLEVRRSELDRIYLVTVSLHFLSGAATRLARLRTLGLLAIDEYPWAISISELDLITRFAEGPDVLLHYIQRRQEIEQSREFPLNDDLDLFAAYLSTRLHSGDFAALMPKADFVYLADFQGRFDLWMEAARRGLALPDIRLELPPDVFELLEQLRKEKTDRTALRIAFALLGLSRKELETVAAAMNGATQQRPDPGLYRRLTVTLQDLAVTIVVTLDGPLVELKQRTTERTVLEKYRRRVSHSIGLGIHLGQPQERVHAYAWSEGPWKPDPKLERRLQDGELRVPPGQRLPGRNEPCICGSGRKFKRCCLDRVRPS